MIFKISIKSLERLRPKSVLLMKMQVLTKWKSYNIMDLTLRKYKNGVRYVSGFKQKNPSIWRGLYYKELKNYSFTSRLTV